CVPGITYSGTLHGTDGGGREETAKKDYSVIDQGASLNENTVLKSFFMLTVVQPRVRAYSTAFAVLSSYANSLSASSWRMSRFKNGFLPPAANPIIAISPSLFPATSIGLRPT